MNAKISFLKELKEIFRGYKKESRIFLLVDAIISLNIAGLLYQYILFIFRSRKIVILTNAWYGIKPLWPVSLVLFFVISYAGFMYMKAHPKETKDYETGIIRSENETFGSAHFQTTEEIEKNFTVVETIDDTNEEIFGLLQDGRVAALSYPPGMNHNRLFCGAPGSGKSAAIIKTDIYQAFKRGDSVICTDSKGALYNETVAVAREYGYTIRVLNLKPTELQNSNGFNVLSSIDTTSVNFATEAAVIANIVISNTQNGEPMDYWAKNELNALKFGIMHCAYDRSMIAEKKNNLYGVYEFFSTHTADDIKKKMESYPNTHPIRMAYSNFAQCEARNQGQVLNGLTTRLAILNNMILGNVLSHDEIDLILPMKQKCIYYVIIPDNDTTYNFIASLFFTTIFRKQCDYSDTLSPEEKKKQLTVFYELDEYKNWGGIVDMDTKMSTVRSRKINVTIILQLINQLTTVHDKDRAKEILNNCTVKGLLSTNDLETAEYFSDLCGKYTIITESTAADEYIANLTHLHADVRYSKGEKDRLLVMPEELMNDKMDRDEMIYIIASMAPVRLKKCFAEKAGEAVHPLEKLGVKLGYHKSNRYLPKWRKELEEGSSKAPDLELVASKRPGT